ncbi:uncharacterized protein LOC107465348 [Arachis duranensis]|uniref:Uncharacterized protein LOC107465348 n=1 Tax=Arachis duranensis TaxID=130453 RepID=A0A6P4C1I2_ARADU|nr:uncharacterized protein LOC107465348 [Arachis duranensis]
MAAEEKDQEKFNKKEEEPQASKKEKQVMEEHPQEKKKEVKLYTPPLPYPQRFKKELKDQQFPNFLEVFKKLEINIPLVEALEQMPFAVIQRGLPPKLKDLGSFIISCTIGNMILEKALCDLGASINLMPLSLMKKLAIEEVKPIRISLQMAYRSLKIPNGVVENLLVKVEEFIFPANFVILDMKE